MNYLVIGYSSFPDHPGDRVRCGTPTQVAAQVERFLRAGYLYVHVDNLKALEELRTGLDAHGDALPPTEF